LKERKSRLADWSDECDDFTDDFIIEEWGIRRVKKKRMKLTHL